jgi:fluoride exporter
VRALVWIGVGLLGGVGAVARFLVDATVSALARGEFPVGTFVVNVSGAALLGLCAGAALRGDALLLVGTAVLGSYTTFSTWAFESHRLGEDGQVALLWLNLALSVAVGLGAVAAGRWLGGVL